MIDAMVLRGFSPRTQESYADAIYIIRTSVKTERMDAPTCVRTYKSLAQVERAFRSMKMMDLRPSYATPVARPKAL